MAKIMKTYQGKAAGESFRPAPFGMNPRQLRIKSKKDRILNPKGAGLRSVLNYNQRSWPQWCGVLGFAAKFPSLQTSLEI